MRQVLLRLLLLLTTFTIGTVFTGLVGQEVDGRAENEIQNLNVAVVYPLSPLVEVEDPRIAQTINSLGRGEFFPIGHACGNGFTTGYFAAGRKRLSHSFRAFQDPKAARDAFYQALSSASELIHQPEFSFRDRRISSRVFTRYEADDGTDYFAITLMERGGDGYYEIVGPD